MSHNTFGHLFRVTTWGESHGPALGCVVDGCPAGLALDEAFIQQFLDKRRPGTSRFVTQRQEADLVKILSGVFEDDRTGGPVTTGTPISLMIDNTDQRSKDYSRDPRPPTGRAMRTMPMTPNTACATIAAAGGSSARETAARVAAGAVARRDAGRRDRDPRRGGADRAAHDRPRGLDLGRDAEQRVLGARREHGGALGPSILDEDAQGGQLGGCDCRGAGHGRARRLGRADLWQAGRRTGRGDDERSTPPRAWRSARASRPRPQ
jgi:hypothetical protein